MNKSLKELHSLINSISDPSLQLKFDDWIRNNLVELNCQHEFDNQYLHILNMKRTDLYLYALKTMNHRISDDLLKLSEKPEFNKGDYISTITIKCLVLKGR